jgi:hypothetical protein
LEKGDVVDVSNLPSQPGGEFGRIAGEVKTISRNGQSVQLKCVVSMSSSSAVQWLKYQDALKDFWFNTVNCTKRLETPF